MAAVNWARWLPLLWLVESVSRSHSAQASAWLLTLLLLHGWSLFLASCPFLALPKWKPGRHSRLSHTAHRPQLICQRFLPHCPLSRIMLGFILSFLNVRQNAQDFKLIIVKWAIPQHESICSVVQPPFCQALEHSLQPRRKPCIHSSHSPFFIHLSMFLATTNQFSVTIDLPVLKISCKRSHTQYDLLYLASFTHHVFEVHCFSMH